MAKILISSLGTGRKNEDGKYEKAQYKIDESVYSTAFIANALTQHLNIDKLFLVGTNKSIWDEAYESFGGTDEEYQMDLMEKKDAGKITEDALAIFNNQLENNLKSKGSQASLIEYGINDEELWGIFEKYLEIAESINDGDELYLDITHSFRSLAMMSLVMTQFASSISNKKFTLKGVYYGMLEYRYETEEKVAPIVNLNILFELQEWIRAIDAMKNYGNLDPLVTLLNHGSKEEKEAEKVFALLNNNINIANLASIQQFVSTASSKINALKKSNNKIINLLSKDIEEFVERLNKDKMSDFQFELAKWFYDNKQYAMSYMALAEAIITKACEIKGYDIKSKEGREAGKNYMKITKYDDYFSPKYPNGISQIRNNIAHQLDNRGSNVTQDIKRLGMYIETFKAFFLEENKVV